MNVNLKLTNIYRNDTRNQSNRELPEFSLRLAISQLVFPSELTTRACLSRVYTAAYELSSIELDRAPYFAFATLMNDLELILSFQSLSCDFTRATQFERPPVYSLVWLDIVVVPNRLRARAQAAVTSDLAREGPGAQVAARFETDLSISRRRRAATPKR
ncbi:hypothetical protein EYR36_000056 [Pleurotus pulmonarius]|nr:hypothetical protein EYR36_000056 [Pleurotus pulmonarius]